MYRLLLIALLSMYSVGVSHAGYLQDYLGNGYLDSAADGGNVKFFGYDTSNPADKMAVGDLVTIIQKFNVVGGNSLGSGTDPKAVFGVYTLKVDSLTNSGSFPAYNNVASFTASDGSNSLTNLLASVDKSTYNATTGSSSFSSNAAFALLSSSATGAESFTPDASNTSTFGFGSDWSLDLVGSIDGTAGEFFQMQTTINEQDTFYYSYHNAGGSTGNTVWNVRAGLSVEGSIDSDAAWNTYSVTPYDGSTTNAQISLTASNTLYSGATSASSFNAGFDGTLAVSAVPEPSSMAVVCLLTVGSIQLRRRKK